MRPWKLFQVDFLSLKSSVFSRNPFSAEEKLHSLHRIPFALPPGLHQILSTLLWLLQQPEDNRLAEIQAANGIFHGWDQRIWLQPDGCYKIVSAADIAPSAKSTQTVFDGSLKESVEFKSGTIPMPLMHCPQTPVKLPQYPQGTEDAAKSLDSAEIVTLF